MEGICGNANGDQSDDILAPDGTAPASESRRDIDIIINAWRKDIYTHLQIFIELFEKNLCVLAYS